MEMQEKFEIKSSILLVSDEWIGAKNIYLMFKVPFRGFGGLFKSLASFGGAQLKRPNSKP